MKKRERSVEKLSKNRGVISVFLLVIFVVTYVAMGMLVDAARYRMSRTYMGCSGQM